jgi:hypothetical protein
VPPPPPPALAPLPAYPTYRERRQDTRPLLIAALVALVALVAVVGYYLLVYVPNRDAREARDRDLGASAQTERPPGAIDEGDGFRPSVIEAEPLDVPSDEPPNVVSSDDGPNTLEDEGDESPPGLEQPPRRSPPAGAPPRAPAAPRPTPSPAPSAPSVPTTPSARPEHVDFAAEYMDRMSVNAVSQALGLYATTVRYYDRGRVDADAVGADKEAYFARFPDRRYALAGPVRVVSTSGATTTLRIDYTYTLGGGRGGNRSGRAWVELDVVPSGGTYLIHGERGDTY